MESSVQRVMPSADDPATGRRPPPLTPRPGVVERTVSITELATLDSGMRLPPSSSRQGQNVSEVVDNAPRCPRPESKKSRKRHRSPTDSSSSSSSSYSDHRRQRKGRGRPRSPSSSSSERYYRRRRRHSRSRTHVSSRSRSGRSRRRERRSPGPRSPAPRNDTLVQDLANKVLAKLVDKIPSLDSHHSNEDVGSQIAVPVEPALPSSGIGVRSGSPVASGSRQPLDQEADFARHASFVSDPTVEQSVSSIRPLRSSSPSSACPSHSKLDSLEGGLDMSGVDQDPLSNPESRSQSQLLRRAAEICLATLAEDLSAPPSSAAPASRGSFATRFACEELPSRAPAPSLAHLRSQQEALVAPLSQEVASLKPTQFLAKPLVTSKLYDCHDSCFPPRTALSAREEKAFPLPSSAKAETTFLRTQSSLLRKLVSMQMHNLVLVNTLARMMDLGEKTRVSKDFLSVFKALSLHADPISVLSSQVLANLDLRERDLRLKDAPFSEDVKGDLRGLPPLQERLFPTDVQSLLQKVADSRQNELLEGSLSWLARGGQARQEPPKQVAQASQPRPQSGSSKGKSFRGGRGRGKQSASVSRPPADPTPNFRAPASGRGKN